jgi:hypothetical protein
LTQIHTLGRFDDVSEVKLSKVDTVDQLRVVGPDKCDVIAYTQTRGKKISGVRKSRFVHHGMLRNKDAEMDVHASWGGAWISEFAMEHCPEEPLNYQDKAAFSEIPLFGRSTGTAGTTYPQFRAALKSAMISKYIYLFINRLLGSLKAEIYVVNVMLVFIYVVIDIAIDLLLLLRDLPPPLALVPQELPAPVALLMLQPDLPPPLALVPQELPASLDLLMLQQDLPPPLALVPQELPAPVDLLIRTKIAEFHIDNVCNQV